MEVTAMAKTFDTLNPKVHRPRLNSAQEALQTQYRPQQGCRYCLTLGTRQHTTWLMEVPRDGAPLEFYCSHCGHYVLVPYIAEAISDERDNSPA
jgi:hypothetical protein